MPKIDHKKAAELARRILDIGHECKSYCNDCLKEHGDAKPACGEAEEVAAAYLDATEWTAVGDGLPEFGQTVEMRWLVNDGKYYEDLRRIGRLGRNTGWVEKLSNSHDFTNHPVRPPTHWRIKLPAPPEASE